MSANEEQIGGDHYKDKGACPHCGRPIEHWDIAWAFRFNPFQYIITKWAFRKKGPEGRHLISDLEKIIHAAKKYIEVVQMEEDIAANADPTQSDGHVKGLLDQSGIPGSDYVNQDR